MTLTYPLSYGDLGQILLAPGVVSISPGAGSHRLVLPVEVIGTGLDREDKDSYTSILLTGTMWTEHPSFRWLTSLHPQTFAVRGYGTVREVTADLTDDQFVALERARGDDDLALRIKLEATLVQAPSGVYPLAAIEAPIRIPRSRWLELLDQLGSEVGIVLRIPSPLTDSALEPPPAASAEDAASLSQATTRLRQARAELRDHQWEHCVATCRRILENIGRLATIPPASQVFSIKADKRTQDQRWAAVYHDVKGMTHPAHHDDTTTTGFAWTRVDAESVLTATAGLLNRYAAQ